MLRWAPWTHHWTSERGLSRSCLPSAPGTPGGPGGRSPGWPPSPSLHSRVCRAGQRSVMSVTLSPPQHVSDLGSGDKRPSREASQRRRAAAPQRQRPACPLCTEADRHGSGTPARDPQKAAVPASGASAWTCSRHRAPPHTLAQGLRHGRILTPKVKSPGGWGSYIIRGRLYAPSYPLEKANLCSFENLVKENSGFGL